MGNGIFISYSRHDIDIVKGIKREIELSTGHKCWMDLDGIESGSEMFIDIIIENIDKCNIFLFMLSENSQISEYAIKELKYAYKKTREDKNRHVVIVNINNCKINGRFEFEYGLADTINWNNYHQHNKFIHDIKKWLTPIINKDEKTYSEILSSIHCDSDKFNCYIGKKVTAQMIYQAVCIDHYVYPEEFRGIYETCLNWWKKNPFIYIMIEDCKTKKIVGYINAMPLSDKYYNKIRNGETIDIDIPVDEIETYDFPDTYKLYFASIAINPDYHNTNAFKTLFDGIVIYLLQLYEREIYFSSIVADAVSAIGEKLCKYIGLKYVSDSNHKSKIYEGKLLPPTIRHTTILSKHLISNYQQLQTEQLL